MGLFTTPQLNQNRTNISVAVVEKDKTEVSGGRHWGPEKRVGNFRRNILRMWIIWEHGC